jgi:hypothetical protein
MCQGTTRAVRLLAGIGERRRFALCVAGALALHAPGALSWLVPSPPRAVIEPPEPEPRLVPVALADVSEDSPPPAPPPPALPVVPPPEPASPEPVATTPTPAPREPSPSPPVRARRKPPSSAGSARAAASVSAEPSADPPPSSSAVAETTKPGEDARAFGGEHGAFRALVCLLPRDTRSARAVEKCEPVASFRTDMINVSPRKFKRGFPGVEKRVDWFGVDYRGRFQVRAAGYYTFRLISDDGALFFIDGEQVLDNDGQHSAKQAKISLPLGAGEHDFRLLYYQGPGYHLALQLFVKGYKTEERPFGPQF